MTNDAVDALKAQLAGVSGAARTRPLVQLSRALADRYWRVGPGSPAGEPHLNGAIAALDEAYGYLDATDNFRGLVAAQLGWLLSARHVAHGGPERDRETGIHVLEEALTFADLPPMLRCTAQVALGQLYLFRSMRSLQSSDFLMVALRSGGPPAGAADADRAVECLRQVLAGGPVSAELTAMAKGLLTTAEAIQVMMSGFGKGPGAFDLTRLTEAMDMIQRVLQSPGNPVTFPGQGSSQVPWLLDGDRLAGLDPLDRPVTVVEGPEPDAPARPRAARPAAARIDIGALRHLLRDKFLLARGGDPPDGGGFYPSVAALLGPHAPRPDILAVDELVALATTIADSEEAVGTDALLLAVALYLRSRGDDGGGWAADDDTGGDAWAAGQSLLTAAGTLPADQPAAVPLLLRLDALLDVDGVGARLAGRYADVTQALRAIGAGGLVYPHADGLLLLDAVTGRLDRAGPAGSLPSRVLVVGDEPVEIDGPVVSYVSSGAQVMQLAQRTRMPLTGNPVFVANPRGDREPASVEAMLLRRAFYPRSTGLGQTIEHVDGSATADDVLAHLDASLLHLGCGVDATGALELAGGTALEPEKIAASGPAGRAAGGLAILPPVPDGFVALADALIGAGFTGAVGWLRPVPEPVAALMLFVLHNRLVDDGLEPAAAVHEVRRWMRDPARKPLPYLPPGYTAVLGGTDLTDRAYWTALAHRGR